ncbi:L-gulonolactone oxidase 3 [Cornus florida]|uniref:L-gulonolactone oxidase 3 n=1 Tax=Cornus florida TaxID=4283 RepID=UPI00289A95D5|nr:L-gulonolactone oxidase 3 [Cornus florida]
MANLGLCLWWLLHTLHLATTIHAMPPPPPVQCNQTGCNLSNSYGVWGDRKECHVPNITYPTTQTELLSAIANANKNKLKVKVVTKFSHTIPKLACPTSMSTNSILISTEMYNSGIEVDVNNLVVTADAGVSLRALIDRVEEAGLSLVAAPYWEGVSVAGMISTGAHGSSWWGKGGAIHDHVVGMSLIVPAKQSEGYAKVVRLEAHDPLLNAAKVSLGLLGVISKVTFSLERGFKRSITYNFTDDARIEDEFMDHATKHEFADITWYPSRHTAVYRYDDRVPLDTTGDGVNDFLGFQSNSILVSKSVRAAEKALENARNVNGKCAMANSFMGYKKLIANGLKNNLIFTGYPVVGYQGKMQTSGSCLYSPTTRIDSACSWDPRIKGLFFYESTAIFPPHKFADFLRDVRKLRDLKPENFCGIDIYNGLLIRFIKASGAYLGQSEDSVVVDFNYYRADESSTPRLNQDVWEEVEQMAFFKYEAKPHWAKNRNLAFLNVQKKYPSFNKFVAAKKQLDPQNMFSSEWSDEILFGREAKKGDGCALEGQCICSEDGHCSPSKGYLCQPGLVYKEARVCRYSQSSMSMTYYK